MCDTLYPRVLGYLIKEYCYILKKESPGLYLQGDVA